MAALLVSTPAALAALGNGPGQLMAQLAGFEPLATESGYVVADGFEFALDVVDDVVVAVTGRAELTEANIAFLGALVGAASGYGDGIAGPVSDFFRTRAADLVGGAALPIQVLEYDLRASVEASPDGERSLLSFRFEPQVIDASAFPAGAHARGPADAPYVIRVFSDFECPFCRGFAVDTLPNIASLLLARGDVRYEHHHFPLKSIHPNAAPAAEAAECAALIAGDEAFWRFHDLLFERFATWAGASEPASHFANIAEAVGIDADAYAECVSTGATAAVVEDAYRAASEGLLLTGTPTVFLNGLKLGDYSSLGEYARLMRLSDALEAVVGEGGE